MKKQQSEAANTQKQTQINSLNVGKAKILVPFIPRGKKNGTAKPQAQSLS